MIAYWATLGVLATVSPMIKRRIELSRAKHRSLAGHSRMAKRLARWMPGYSLGEAHFSTATVRQPMWQHAARPLFSNWPSFCRRATNCR